MQISTLKTGLFFGTDTGNTEDMADKICESLAEYGCIVEMHDIADVDVAEMQNYDFLICGIPTWDFGGIQEEWENQEAALEALDLSGKRVALYGLGDQFGYGDFFLDAMGWLYKHILAAEADVIGHWPTTGYDFEDSKAVNKERTLFCGLAIDEDQQFELSDARIKQWVAQLVQEIEQSAVA